MTLLMMMLTAMTAQAVTKTYIFNGENNSPTQYTGYCYEVNSPSTYYYSVPSPWTFGTDGTIYFNLPDNIKLTLTSSANAIAYDSTNGIMAQGAVTLTISGYASDYIYHVGLYDGNDNLMMLDADGKPVRSGGVTECDYWSMTSGNFSHNFTNGIAFKKIVVGYGSTIPFTDAVISGIANEYTVSNAAVAPTPTVTWHGTTLTSGTHYTVTYQNNTTAGTATVTATGKGIFSNSTSASRDYTLRWATYTVQFNKNHSGASGSMSNQTFTYNTAQTLNHVAFTAPDGLQFAGWAKSATGDVVYTDGQSVSNLTATDGATVTLYAKWYNWGIADGADGSAEHPYIITDKNDLDLLANRTNDGNDYSGKHFQLGADITYTHNTAWNNASSTENNYTAIGNIDRPFSGTFDGQGHTISGIRIYKSGVNGSFYQGLFGCIGIGGTVKRVNLSDTRITGYIYTGGIAGYAYSCTIEDCTVAADVCIHAVQDKSTYHGGIVGNNAAIAVQRCISRATLTVKNDLTGCKYYGGIVGYNNGFTFTDCIAVGAVIPNVNGRGAIVGYKYDGTLTRNYYRSCTVAGMENATGVGQGTIESSTTSDPDGAKPLYALALPDGAAAVRTATATLPGTGNATYADGADIGGNKYYIAGATVTLSASREGYTFGGYASDDVTISEGAFTMPAKDVTITATWTPTTTLAIAAKEVDGNYWTTFYCGDAGYGIDAEENACAYTATVSGTTITLHTLGKVIPQGTAVIIVGKDASIGMTTSTAEAEYTVDNDLHGVDVATALTGVKTSLGADAILVLSNKNEHFGFHELATTNVPARKAFLALNGEAAKARELTMVFEDATGIHEITDPTPAWEGSDGAWYSLDGRRLSGKPVKSGVYVKNGRKFIIE